MCGYMTVREQMGVVGVGFIHVDEAVQGRHIGTQLYEHAARLACSVYGKPLASDLSRSEQAEGFWRKQRRKGRASKFRVPEIGGTRYVLPCPAPKRLDAFRKGRRR